MTHKNVPVIKKSQNNQRENFSSKNFHQKYIITENIKISKDFFHAIGIFTIFLDKTQSVKNRNIWLPRVTYQAHKKL
jgi:hypothetical protein